MVKFRIKSVFRCPAFFGGWPLLKDEALLFIFLLYNWKNLCGAKLTKMYKELAINFASQKSPVHKFFEINCLELNVFPTETLGNR